MQKRNAYREGKKGVQVWLPLALYGRMRSAAEGAGLSLQEWLTDVVRERVDGDVDAVAGGAPGVAVAGVGVRSVGGRGGESDSVESAVGGVDWDALLAAGRLAKVRRDPIEDIA